VNQKGRLRVPVSRPFASFPHSLPDRIKQSAEIEMKTNPRNTRIFLALLTHRERHRARPGLLTGWIGRLTALPANQRLELWTSPVTRVRSTGTARDRPK